MAANPARVRLSSTPNQIQTFTQVYPEATPTTDAWHSPA